MPTLCIHSKSSLIPSLVMLPFIQCHHTRGLAESGGALNPASKGSPALATCACPLRVIISTKKPAEQTRCVDFDIELLSLASLSVTLASPAATISLVDAAPSGLALGLRSL